uniref:DDB1- and CUL4-associated factor homolog 1 n=1 Tax=Nicotiana sylvestris TaxID=4096 RepID=A0A1U7VQ55_NICSY|nr:PREDICTED: DDB1- and CUL4-associated factor homolog 1 [Nicotiana sylvestris]
MNLLQYLRIVVACKNCSLSKSSSDFFVLPSCLFTIGSIQGIMERACALQLLECPQDQARGQLNLLHGAASVRSGVSGALTAPEVLTSYEKQIAYHTCRTWTVLQSKSSVAGSIHSNKYV